MKTLIDLGFKGKITRQHKLNELILTELLKFERSLRLYSENNHCYESHDNADL